MIKFDLNKNKDCSFLLSIITVILAVFFTISVIYAWTAPTEAPPGGNVSAPINTGTDSQYKIGKLGASTSGVDPSFGLTVGSSGIKVTGDSLFEDDLKFNGEIMPDSALCSDNQTLKKNSADNWVCADFTSGTTDGSGTVNYIPLWTGTTTLGSSPLIVDSSGPIPSIDFSNYKLANVSQIDPVFNIDGIKYTSYLTDMIGQKIEVMGEAELEGNELVINLEEQEQGSDLWLFWKTVDKGSVIPFISPQSDADIYSYIDNSDFVIKLRAGERDAKFSYRLIGTRIDHADDLDNLYYNQEVEHFINIDELTK